MAMRRVKVGFNRFGLPELVVSSVFIDTSQGLEISQLDVVHTLKALEGTGGGNRTRGGADGLQKG